MPKPHHPGREPSPVSAFEGTLAHDGDVHLSNVHVNPMSIRRHPHTRPENAFTELQKKGAYRVYMAQHARIVASIR